MQRQLQLFRRWLLGALILFCVAHAEQAFASFADDTSFFTTSVPPNVMVIVDNSGSMNEVVWHPLYHPQAVYNTLTCPYVEYDDWVLDADGNPTQEYWKCLKYPLCNYYTSAQTTTSNYTVSPSTTTYPNCESRTIFYDSEVSASGNSTRWSQGYLNWYLSKNASLYDVLRDPENGRLLLDGNGEAQESTVLIKNNITATTNGTRSACLVGEGWATTYALYRRARITAVKHILRDIICQANQTGKVRFGLAKFKVDGTDPWGGFVTVPINDYSASHGTALQSQINSLEGETWTPLGETLYYIYRYFMGRTSASIPYGQNGTTKFPAYDRNTSGSTGGTVPGSPVQYTCQRNFVIYLTDGEPTKDDFAGIGLSTFASYVGDYNKNNTHPEKEKATTSGNYESEYWGSTCPGTYTGGCDRVAWFLDDIAMFMQENDARPDLAGVQNVETYTVGFTTTPWANSILQKAAEGPYYRDLNSDGDYLDTVSGKEETINGNGHFFYSNNAEELTRALNEALADILNKTQFFTAATVPATRTTANNNFYASFFKPRKDTHFWEGHVVNYSLYLDGSILDRYNDCALIDDNGAPIPILDCAVSDASLPTDSTGWEKAWWDAGDKLNDKSPNPAASIAAERRTLYYSPASGLTSGATPPLFVEGTVTQADLGLTSLSSSELLTYQNAGSEITSTTVPERDKLVAELVWHLRGCTFKTARNKAMCTKRENMLGDVFHANPLLVGPPSATIVDASYKEFREDNKTRYDRLFVASNDGFLHVFDAGPSDDGGLPIDDPVGHGTGEELWGFMPYEVRTRVKTIPSIGLANTSARSGVSDTGLAEYFVDGSPQAADVWLYDTPSDSAKTKDEWITMLLAGLRQGGRSYYALDITGSTPQYLWEFPQYGAVAAMPGEQVGHMGETWSEPIITRVRVQYSGSLSPSGRGYERWVAIFGAGYSVKSDPNNVAYDPNSLEGRAIFVVDVKTGKVLAQKYFKASPAAADVSNGAVADMKYAIASRPAVFDMNFDGYADVIYIGDLGGNMWKWIIEPQCTTFITNCVGDDAVNGSGVALGQPNWPFELFFQAPAYSTDSSLSTMTDNSYRSFYKPLSGTYVRGNVYLVAATGNRANIGALDLSTTNADNQRLYVFVDDAPLRQDYVRSGAATATSVPAIFGSESVTGLLAPYSGYSFRTGGTGQVWRVQDLLALQASGSAPEVCAASGTSSEIFAGYYIEGEESEKFVTNPVISLGRAMIGSYVPESLSGTNPCLGGGVAYLWAFDLDCGTPDLANPSTGAPTSKIDVGGGVPSDIVISSGSDSKPTNCASLSGNLKALCDNFDEECQVKEYMVSGDGGLHNNCRKGKRDPGPRFKAWRIER